MIKVKGLTYIYTDGTKALDNVNIIIPDKKIIAFIGENGSGKTTFAKCISGIIKPPKGTVFVDEKDITEYKIKERSRKIGYVFQNPDHQIFSNTVEKELKLGLINLLEKRSIIKKRINQVIKITGIKKSYLKENPFFLPKGIRQRIAIASILIMEPEYIIVDEPTTGQDYKQSISVMEFLKKIHIKNKITIIIITHEMYIVNRYAEKILRFKKGKIFQQNN